MTGKKTINNEDVILNSLFNTKILFLNILNKLTFSSVYIAINSMLVIVFSSYLYSFEIKFEILVTAFFTTFAAYSLNKITDRVEDSINSPEINSEKGISNKNGLLLVLLSFIFLCIFSRFETMVIVSISVIISVLYSVKFTRLFPRFKEVMGIKSILVALCWAFTGALLPIVGQSLDRFLVVLVFLYIFIQLLVNTIICDIRDVEGDKVSGVKTIPIVLGVKKTKNLLLWINSMLIPWLLFCQRNKYFITYLPALWGGLIYGYLLILAFSKKNQDRLSVVLLVDGEWIPIVFVMNMLR